MINTLKKNGIQYVDSCEDFPEAYRGSGNIKAVILGADPTSFKDGKIRRLKVVFDLNLSEKRDKRFFSSIERNLNLIGLSLEEIYVQNLCRNYFTRVTYDHKKNWLEAASFWIEELDKELVARNIDRNIPILVTSDIILKALVKDHTILKAKEYYSAPINVPILAENSLIGRPLVPFYRGLSYFLGDKKWKDYRSNLCQRFDETGLIEPFQFLITNALQNTDVKDDGTVVEQRYLVGRINHLFFVIRLNDHNPPHFHVLSKDRNIDASFRISDGSKWRGKISQKDGYRVRYFYETNRDNLIKYWNHYHPNLMI